MNSIDRKKENLINLLGIVANLDTIILIPIKGSILS